MALGPGAGEVCRNGVPEPDWRVRFAAYDRLLKLMEKDDAWRREFIEKDKAKPTEMTKVPQFETVQEFEEWAKTHDPLANIEANRKAATEVHVTAGVLQS